MREKYTQYMRNIEQMVVRQTSVWRVWVRIPLFLFRFIKIRKEKGMDELKIKTPKMKGLVGRAITKYLKKKGIDIDVAINDIDGVSSDETGVKLRADVVVTMTTTQLIKFLC